MRSILVTIIAAVGFGFTATAFAAGGGGAECAGVDLAALAR